MKKILALVRALEKKTGQDSPRRHRRSGFGYQEGQDNSAHQQEAVHQKYITGTLMLKLD